MGKTPKAKRLKWRSKLPKLMLLQENRDKLVQGIRDKDEKLKKFSKKKNKLENFMEEHVGKNRKAKNELEREILEIKGKIEGLRKVNKRVEEQPESRLRVKWLESIENRIEMEEKELECPVCLEVASIPIFCCEKLHLICSKCRP